MEHATPLDASMRARMLDELGLAVIATDVTGTVTYWNRQAERLYGWSAQEAVGRPITSLTVSDVGQPAAAEIMDTLAAGGSWTGAFPVRRKDGSEFVALVTDGALQDEDGAIAAVVGISMNLGETLRPYLRQSSEAAVVTSRDGVVFYASPAVLPVLGWDDDLLGGRLLADLVHPDDVGMMRKSLEEAAVGQAPVVHELRVRRRDGSYVWVEGRWTDMLADPSVRGLLCVLRDVEERHAVLDRLTDLALTDSVTGLPNRSVLLERLERATARREPRGAVLFVDMDDFKQVNDTHGHATGDLLLRAVGRRLRQAVRPEDSCGRWAGDEFLIVTESIGTRAEAEVLAARVSSAVEQPLQVDGTSITPRASVGLALLASSQSVAELLHTADQEMYRVKRTRRAEAVPPEAH